MSLIGVTICQSPWGIGGYRAWDEDAGEWVWLYGLYRPENPHDFSPDYENCSAAEINQWMRDLEAWDKPRHEQGICVKGECVICRGEARSSDEESCGKGDSQGNEVQR